MADTLGFLSNVWAWGETVGTPVTDRTKAITRRSVLATGVAAGAISATGISSTSASAAVSRVRTDSADALVESFGVGVHLNYRGSVYGNHAQVINWLERLGVRHVRTRLTPAPDQFAAFTKLANRGIRVQGVVGSFGDPQKPSAVLAAVNRHFAHPERIFSAFEGINEPNNDGRAWIDETRRKTIELHRSRKALGLTHIPLVAPALARVTSGGVQGRTTWQQAGNLGDLSRYVSVANMHVYPQGRSPSEDIHHFAACARRVAGPGGVMCTEGGYFTARNYRGTANPVPEAVAAAYGPQQILEHWNAGTKRFFRYELLDEPHASATDREGTLGMIHTGGAWRAKPDFTATRRLLSAFSDRGPRHDPRPIAMALSDKPGDLRWAVFAKRNGTHILALWLNRMIYHPIEHRWLVKSTSSTMDSVVLTLGSRRDLRIEHLSTSGRATLRPNTSRHRVALTAGVTLVTIR